MKGHWEQNMGQDGSTQHHYCKKEMGLVQSKKALEKEEYPIPMADQLTPNFRGSYWFSSIDCIHAFYEFEIDEETQKVLYATTPVGKYRFKRMLIGAPPTSG